ncbi:MAG: aminotransferase class III-fold pyridoxal phosphate-dependent enzyme [Clostridiales bacterium]|jgi:glutamate-1-semialdehyde 2,1-aminomutase|nr:aminotransferase class III-fold pyridoxal phosphate-dependent enzyme [Clostridiales bacterium]HOB64214.1 aminotransferase class III-fold pyridoxal phosphate-dependent enzyme [Clostridia bacterium]HOK81717.1 aminotransferase class III-fold pyridoxal phosphate-dependent enzyme [Clostridia bacterium]HOL60614.1 aminotransferase class III-fold pyridoxal phosphate-dependent enzyme [Clostridia bacterium]HPO53021.1 aminotransferase class III-fold pyridoxal phosphate-dependent enzyme [Clostridia bact
MKQYAISKWESAQEINAQLKNLTSQPIYKVSKEYYEGTVLKYFNEKCAKSKEITTEAKDYIPGGVQHNLAFNKPFPLCITKAEGAYLYDIDGNEYIDFLQAGGPTVLGSNYPAVREKVIELINECGPVTGLFHEAELLLAKEINKHMPAVEMFRMLGSGTESVMASTRLARLVTGKARIIKMGGAYHGWSDQMVYGLKIPGTRRFLESHGIHRRLMSLTDEVRPNDLKMLEMMLKRNTLRGGTAAVIVEPVGPESGTRPIDFDYNKEALKLAHKYGALFIFDEVVTGFRVGLGGAQGYFGVEPDVTIFGKVIAGGYPAAGGIGGKKEYISRLAAGVGTLKAKAYVGGTLAANPLSSYAGYLTIKEIEKTNACVKAGEAGDKLTAGLKALIKKHNLPYVAYNQGSIVHLECSGAMSYDFSSMFLPKSLIGALSNKKIMTIRKEAMEEMGAAYMANGIVTLAGSRLYTSMATTDEVVEEALRRFDRVFAEVVKTDEGVPAK